MNIQTIMLKQALKDPYFQFVELKTKLKSSLGLGSFPDFIIIGAQKGGTSSLYQYLVTHPQILGAARKEVQFFTINYHKGFKWYKACFPASLNRRIQSRITGRPAISGEASPYYIFHPNVPKRIAKTLPDIKIIALLRDPVDRLISHYHHMVRIGREELPLQDAIAREEQRLSGEFEKIQDDPFHPVYMHTTFSYLARGRYIEQLERYSEYFPKNRMFIIKSENFFVDVQTEYDKVLNFLNLDGHKLENIKPRNAGIYGRETYAEIKQELRQYFKPYNERLYDFLGEDFGW